MTFQTFTGREYLMIDIANNYGHDKWTWDRRINWFKNNEHRLDELLATAEEPALFYAGVQAYRDVLAGKPIGYMISLDATSSGLQILAALTGDRKAATLCNVLDTGDREDAYTVIYDIMTDAIGESGKIKRDDVKQAIMTSLYGSTAMPKQVFGEGLIDIFYQTMQAVAPAAWELNQAFLAMWNPEAYKNSWVLPDNFHVHVKVMGQKKEVVNFLNEPFDIYYAVNEPIEEGRSLAANSTHSVDGMIVREMGRRCDYDPYIVGELVKLVDNELINRTGLNSKASKDDNLVLVLWDHYEKTGFLSARIIEHLNADNIGHVDPTVISTLLHSLPNKPFKVISVHDCFRCLPHYGNDLRKQYNILLQLIGASSLLDSLISQIIQRDVSFGKLHPDMHHEIIHANYALS